MKKLLLTLGTAASVVAPMATVVACGNNDAAPRIGVTVYNAADPFIGITTGGINSAANQLGVPISIADAANDQTKTNEAVDTFITRGVEALVIGLVDPAAANTVAQKAAAANTPVVFYNKEPEQSIVDTTKDTYYVGATEEDSGRLQGQLIFEDMKSGIIKDRDGDTYLDYKLFAGESGHPAAEDRTKYVQEELKTLLADFKADANNEASHPLMSITDINIIGQVQYTDWSETQGLNYMSTAITAEKTDDNSDLIDFVITNNDGVALGSVQALKAASRFVALPEDTDAIAAADYMHVPVYGVDATDPAKAAIKEGWMGGTILNDGAGQGAISIQLAWNIMNEETDLLKGMPEGTAWDTADVSTANSVIRVPFLQVTRDDV